MADVPPSPDSSGDTGDDTGVGLPEDAASSQRSGGSN